MFAGRNWAFCVDMDLALACKAPILFVAEPFERRVLLALQLNLNHGRAVRGRGR